MSIYVSSLVWKFSKSDGSTLLTALAIADFCDDDGRAFPAVATLAKKARISDRSVQYALQSLRELGELQIEVGTGPHGCNTYFVVTKNLRGANSAGVQNTTEGGAAGCTQTTIEPSLKKKQDAGASVEVAFDAEAGKFNGIDTDQIARWAVAFPAISVPTEIERACCWLICNPSKRPKANVLRFLNGWLGRAAGGRHQPPTGATASQPAAGHRLSRAERSIEFSRGLFSKPTANPANVIDVDAREIA